METIKTVDGLTLHLRQWPATGTTVHGTVQIVHGLGEHIGRYAELAATLNASGWHVAGHDHRGHGHSEGPRGGLPDSQALLADLALAIDRLRGPGRHVLLGHSLGGLIAARFAAQALVADAAPWSRPLDALVLSSPALDPGLSAAQRALLAVASRLAPDLPLSNGLKPAWISRDPEVVRRYIDDPLVHDRVTPRLVRFIVDGGEFVRRLAPMWRVPTLLLWAGADRCVASAGSAGFAAAAPPSVVAAQAFSALYHEIFNEPERAEVVLALQRWLGRLVAPAG